ncbi:hypothetical protein M501DRAFT_1014836 [Patellaria atrata CBS 101060]|uniref:Mid2 domain-containing protein n=1 Tax=Patellaria atrata CBS 101060 TaxID=1346257 RepID=A0A9P4VUQ0_9PEZI|nr:hypothetical protein M501DRAFT_1014836 [Patellaria atrata CBS 101060]
MFANRKFAVPLFALLYLLTIVCAFEADGFFYKRQDNVIGGTGPTSTFDNPSDITTSTPTVGFTTSEFGGLPTTTETPPLPPTTLIPNPPTTFTSTIPPTTPPSTSPSTSSPASSTPTSESTSEDTNDEDSATITSFELTTFTSALVSTSAQVFVTTILTVSGDHTVPVEVTTSRPITFTTGFVTGTHTALIQPGDDNGGQNSGMESKTKALIGGLVGGIGGLLLLGGIGIAFWKVWGRKRRNVDDDDDIHSGTGMSESVHRDKRSSVGQPFQATLDRYHEQPANTNPAANF